TAALRARISTRSSSSVYPSSTIRTAAWPLQRISRHHDLGLLAQHHPAFLRQAVQVMVKRGAFRSVADLQAAINRLVWTADRAVSLAAVRRRKQASKSNPLGVHCLRVRVVSAVLVAQAA